MTHSGVLTMALNLDEVTLKRIREETLVYILEGDVEVPYQMYVDTDTPYMEPGYKQPSFIRDGVVYDFHTNTSIASRSEDLCQRLLKEGKVRLAKSLRAYDSTGVRLPGWVAWFCPKEDWEILRKLIRGI